MERFLLKGGRTTVGCGHQLNMNELEPVAVETLRATDVCLEATTGEKHTSQPSALIALPTDPHLEVAINRQHSCYADRAQI